MRVSIAGGVDANGKPQIQRVLLDDNRGNLDTVDSREVYEYLQETGEMISRYLDGFNTDFSDRRVAVGNRTLFFREVIQTAAKIPYGTTVSYGMLARNAGHPCAVRAAASVMRNNHLPILIPCHRVISANGCIGGYMGEKSGPFVELKKLLLALENKNGTYQ